MISGGGTIADVISWKWSDQPGMRCAEVNDVLEIVEFPGGVPSQSDQDLWIAEYNTWYDAGGPKDNRADLKNADELLKIFVLCLNDGTFVPGSNYTVPQIKSIFRAKINGG